MRKILVTGATGFLGSYVVAELKKMKYDFKCLVRKEGDAYLLEKEGIQIVYGDVTNKPSLISALKGVDTVLHMAGVIKSSSKELYYDVNERGTKNLVEACEENKVKKMVHISTQDVVFQQGDYSISKLKGEEVVKNSALAFTVFRPTVIYGAGECGLKDLVSLIRNFPIVPVLGNGQNKFQPVYAGDVAKAIVKAVVEPKDITKDKTRGRTYSIGGPDRITFDELVDLIMKELKIKKAKIHVPALLLKPFVQVYEKVAPNPFMTVDSLKLLTCDKTCDNSAAITDLGYKPIHFKDGIKYMLKHPKHDDDDKTKK